MTESWEVPECRELNGDLADGGLLDIELLDFQIQGRAGNSKFGSRTIWTSHFSFTFCQGCFDELPLIGMEILNEVA